MNMISPVKNCNRANIRVRVRAIFIVEASVGS
jgi:hypothetical protein